MSAVKSEKLGIACILLPLSSVFQQESTGIVSTLSATGVSFKTEFIGSSTLAVYFLTRNWCLSRTFTQVRVVFRIFGSHTLEQGTGAPQVLMEADMCSGVMRLRSPQQTRFAVDHTRSLDADVAGAPMKSCATLLMRGKTFDSRHHWRLWSPALKL